MNKLFMKLTKEEHLINIQQQQLEYTPNEYTTTIKKNASNKIYNNNYNKYTTIAIRKYI